MINPSNMFLGVGPAIYSDPILMGEVLATVLPENLGTDAWALADAYTQSPPAGIEFKRFLQKKMAASTPENWRDTLDALSQKNPWAFQKGCLNTRIDPLLAQWLNLQIEETFTVPTWGILEELQLAIRNLLAPLLKPAIYLKDEKERYHEYSTLLKELGFTSSEGLDRLTEFEKRAGLAVPETVPSLESAKTRLVVKFLRGILDSGCPEEEFNQQDFEIVEAMLRAAVRKVSEYQDLKKISELSCRIVLARTADLNRYALTVYYMDGIPFKNYELDLFQSIFDDKKHLFVRTIPTTREFINTHWTCGSTIFESLVQIKIEALFLKLQKKIDVKIITIFEKPELYDWIYGAIPLTHALKRNNLSKIMRRWEHPYRPLFGQRNGSYEAMRPIKGAQLLFLNLWVGLENREDPSFTDFFLREIDPNPDFEKPEQYYFGFATNTGRSVDYAINYTGPDGTRWHHLNAVGVGKTEKARIGDEERDGLLPLEGAQKRFYLSNLMHYLGLRTSLGVAVVNRNRIRQGGEKRPGIPQTQATLYELRREQLRLNDLEDMEWAEEAVAAVKAKIAAELDKKEMRDEEYVTWLAKTLGEQFAIMEFFEFDHGELEKSPQLHPGNVGLDGSIYDFDTAHFSFDKKRVHERYEKGHRISRSGIRALEKEWRHNPKINSWLGHLLKMADVPFYDIMEKAEQDKRKELEKSGIDPKAKIREFNVKIWNPYMRSLARNPQAIYHPNENGR